MQKDEAADGGLHDFLDTALCLRIFVGVAGGLVYEEGLFSGAGVVGVVCFKPLLKRLYRHVMYEQIAPGGGLLSNVFIIATVFRYGYSFYSRRRWFVSPDYVNALW